MDIKVIKMSEADKLFEDIEMCLKRMSDFLGEDGYRETRKYIDRYTEHLNNLKNKKDKNSKELLTKKEIDFIKGLLRFGNYRDSEKNGKVKFIKKRGYFLYLHFSEFHSNSVYIDKDIYFKGLEENEEYTLKELGWLEE